MALLDFLKNKKEKEKAAEKKPVVLKPKKVEEAPKETKVLKVSGGDGAFSYNIVKDPHISEKGTYLAEMDKYMFKVYERSNKMEIKKAVEGIYGVNVLSVNVITVPRKKRRLGKTEGFKKGYKKALVTLKKGQKIEVY